jgi:uncharacterized membrane protein
MHKWFFILHEHAKQLWFRCSLYCLLAVITALLGVALNNDVPSEWLTYVKRDAVQKILEIMASSMLIVATFALSVMVQAYGAAATTATPRATQLLTEDASAQRALAAFIGAFLFSIVGLVALSAGIYGTGGVVVLFAATVMVILLVIIMLLRWIEQLTRLGRVEESIDLVEAATRKALIKRARHPFLGGRELTEIPELSHPVSGVEIGYVQYIDMEKLQHLAEHHQIHVYLDILPGSFCDSAHHIAYTSNVIDEHTAAQIRETLVIGGGRTFPQDPRFGLVVLSEIALRALSPSTNDPGTAIDVIGTGLRLLHIWAQERQLTAHVTHDRVWVARLQEADFFEDLFAPIARQSRGQREVTLRLQKALRAIGKFAYEPFEQPARSWSNEVLERAKEHLSDVEFARLEAICQGLDHVGRTPT